jgi:hypothetical protein
VSPPSAFAIFPRGSVAWGACPFRGLTNCRPGPLKRPAAATVSWFVNYRTEWRRYVTLLAQPASCGGAASFPRKRSHGLVSRAEDSSKPRYRRRYVSRLRSGCSTAIKMQETHPASQALKRWRGKLRGAQQQGHSGSSLPINDACLRDAAMKQFGAFLLEGTHKRNSKPRHRRGFLFLTQSSGLTLHGGRRKRPQEGSGIE